MNPRYEFVAFRAGHRCEYCHAPEVVFNFPFEVEHIVPLHLYGDDTDSNWALACRACNVKKGAYLTSFDPITQEQVRLFHPRLEQWREHFAIHLVTATIESLTPTGRATALRLGMNSAGQLAARRLWIRLGPFT